MRSEILFICPKYPPLMDGLSGHTLHLTNELSKRFKVSLLTSESIPHSEDSNIEFFPLISKWNFSQLKSSLSKINSSYDHIFIQYVPSLYAKRGGINFSILLFFIYIRFYKKCNVSVMFHELYYPLLPNWKALVLNICHKIMLFITLNSSQIHFFSTNKFLNLSKKFSLFSSKKIHLPVGSSISIGIPKTKKNTQKNQYIIFGASHPSKKYNLIFDTFEKAFGENINFALIIIGTTIKDLEKEYKLPLNFKRYARVENKLDDSEVIAYFNKSNYLISYFSDGLTTRRSSVISALANDLPVISTLSKETDHILREEDSITLFSCDEEQYKKSLFSFIKNPNVIPYNSASKFYERELSWGHVVEKIEKAWS